MFKPISLFVGLRYTRARRSNRSISIISLISTVGLILGVAALIVVLSVMNGFDRELKSRVLGMVPQAVVSSYQFEQNWPALVKFAEKQKHVVGAAPFTQVQGMLAANAQVNGVLISGIDPAYERRVSIIQNYMVAGRLDDLKSGEFGIVIGKKMAEQLGLALNDKVTLVLPEATPSPAGMVPRFKRFTVVGIFDLEAAEMESMLAYIALNDAAKLLRMPDGAQGVRMKLDDLFTAPKVTQSMLSQLPPNFYAVDWTNTHGSLFSAIRMEKTLVSLLLLLIVVVAAFNIVSSLIMLVADKKADIAILRTLGASPKTITKIFMIQGLVIGVMGTVIGAVVGIVLALVISPFTTWLMNAFGLHLLDAYFINYLPSYLKWTDVLVIVSTSLLISFLATIYPAYRAARVQPAEALRYE